MVQRTRRRPARARMVEASRKKIHIVRTHGIYVLPNLFTTASLVCAFLAIIRATNGVFDAAAVLIVLSMVFDGMDGRVARLTHTQSEFGVQFDSIADMTAFGVAPAVTVYQFLLHDMGGIGCMGAFVFCLCAGVRLARFNCNVGVVDKRFFQGLPSPAAAALVAGFVWLTAQGKMPTFILDNPVPYAFVITLYAGLTMVCNAPFFSGMSAACLKTKPFWFAFALSVIFIVVSESPAFAVFILFCLYALSGYVYQAWLFYTDKPNPVLPVRDEAPRQGDEKA